MPGLIGFEDVAHYSVCSLGVGGRRVIRITRLRGVRCMRLRDKKGFRSEVVLPLMGGVDSTVLRARVRKAVGGEWQGVSRCRCYREL